MAGVAWAQHKGIDAVEVQVDGGAWHEATLATVPNIDTWRQWVWQWENAAVGPHLIEARATDKTGYTQTVAPGGRRAQRRDRLPLHSDHRLPAEIGLASASSLRRGRWR